MLLQFRGGRLIPAALAIIVMGLGLLPADASSASISHPYKTTGGLPNGSLVVLDATHSDYVQPANVKNASRLLGVAVADGESLLAVDSNQGTTQVATNGNASALVSTVNGDVHLGDQITASPFNGVGMKATAGGEVLGLAQSALDDHTQGTITEMVTDTAGKSRQITVGLVRVNIAVSSHGDKADGDLTGPQKVVHLLTGHEVSTLRALISLLVALVALLALVTLIYASIYGSIIAVGRNPLAKYTIFRTLGSVLGMAVLTALVAGVTLFLLLR